jgi:Cu-Zn family superoxide dismutase
MNLLRRPAAWILALALALTSCRLPYVPGVTSAPPTAGITMKDATGRIVGSGVLLQESDGVRILLDVKGFKPGDKGIHIHTVGRCDPPSFNSAGGHFNPGSKEHGLENPKGPHAGDLPNITIEADGQGHLEYTDPRVTLESGANSLFSLDGTSIVIHEGPDDMRTDPAGNSGARIACGVIVRAKA